MTAKMALTLPGLFSTMLDNMGLMAKSFGEEMAPMMKEMLRGITDLAKWLKNLDDSTKQLIINVLGLVAALGPLLFLGGKLIKFFLTGLTPLNLFIMALGVLVVAIIALNEALKKAEEVHQTHARLIKEEIANTEELKNEYIALQSKLELSREERARMSTIESILTKRIGETAFALNEQTGELELNLAAYETYVSRKTELMLKEEQLQLTLNLSMLSERIVRTNDIRRRMQELRDMGVNEEIIQNQYGQMLENAIRETDLYELKMRTTQERIAALKDVMEGVTEEIDDAAGDMEDLVDGTEDATDEIEKLKDKIKSPIEEDIPLLTIPTKVKQQLEGLQELTQNIGQDFSSTVDVSAPSNILSDLVWRIEQLNQGVVDVNIKIEHDEGINATITEYDSTGNANVNIDINTLLGNTLSEVMP